jgi:hypothetical protein
MHVTHQSFKMQRNRNAHHSPIFEGVDEQTRGHEAHIYVNAHGVQGSEVEWPVEQDEELVEDHEEKQAEILLHTPRISISKMR